MTIHEKPAGLFGKVWYLPKGPCVADTAQLASVVADPGKLQAVAVLHARRQPELPRWRQVRVMNDHRVLGPEPVREIQTLATWDVVHPLDPERGL